MKKVITVTLNPAFDLHYGMENFEVGKENYVNEISCQAAGKGVNISRALLACGVESVAYLILGEENGAQFESMLEADGIRAVSLYTKGRVRENITLHPKAARETRISLDNFGISGKELDGIYALLESELDSETFVSFSGRIPKGIGTEDVMEFLGKLKEKGARLFVDCNPLTAEDLKKIKPLCIKPNEDEVLSLTGKKPQCVDDAARLAAELAGSGISEEVMISLGGEGLAWSDGVRCTAVFAPKIAYPISTIGAGDSAVAGYLAGRLADRGIEHTLRLSAACGSAACLTEGTKPPRTEDMEKLYDQTQVKLL